MLARASSDAGTRLRRSKSTSVVHRSALPVIESLDPDTAQQHAIAAATKAFARSQTQRSTERKGPGSIDLRRSKSTTSRKSLTSQGSHFPPREMSVRSVPVQRSTQVVSVDRLAAAPAPQAERNSTFNSPAIGMRPLSSLRPVPSQPPVVSSEYVRPTSQPKPHGRGIPSSLTSQQIRKARSMYYASSVQTGSPIARPPAKYLITPPDIETSPSWAHAPKSYIPTRAVDPSPLAVPRVPVSVAPGETIDTARDRFLQDFQRQTVKHKPSMFLAPFKKRQDKSKDSTKLHLSAVTPAGTTADHFTNDTAAEFTVDDFMPQSDPKDRRSFSGSLKKTIRKVFRRTTNKSTTLPVQHIEASRDYFTDVPSPMTDSHAEIPSPDEGLLQRVRSRTPSLDRRTRQSASRSSSKESAHSNRSLHSEANISQTSTSRVTSWDTSASGETLTQRAIKRLTVIHESKDSVGSLVERPAPATTLKKPLPLPTFSAFKDPMHMESLTEEALTPPVDPKRVFSALMREIDASNQGAVSTHHEPRSDSDTQGDIFGSSNTMDVHLAARELHSSTSKSPDMRTTPELTMPNHRPESVATRSVQSKKTSFRTLGQAIRSTIRTVTPAGHPFSPSSEQLTTLQSDKHASSTNSSSQSKSVIELRPATLKKLHVPKKRNLSVQKDASIETSIPTAEQIEIRVAKAKARWQGPLNESVTPQFPREADRLHAMANLDQDTAARTLDAHKNQLTKPIQMPMSPSIYSRNTDGVSLPPTDSVLSLANTHEHEPVNQEGSAVILTSQSVRSYVIGTPSPNRVSSTRSSRDWKAWLSQEVSSIETASQEELKICGNYDVSSQQAEDRSHRSIRTSQVNPEDAIGVDRGSLDIPTPRAPSANPRTGAEQQESSSSGSEDCLGRAYDTFEELKNDRSPLGSLSSGEIPVSPPIVSAQQLESDLPAELFEIDAWIKVSLSQQF
ncbi:hypothetical protein E8E13_011413 [Curvularia kusanoi]|uniref:Uncharacterized protein n=1 Tax=Curvularia kusanoi TaxID=90978 RepID=A0A9P4TPG0_CURKU|nr:hypothetical protein E8E13_011413 [Curvularia kusanoi]